MNTFNSSFNHFRCYDITIYLVLYTCDHGCAARYCSTSTCTGTCNLAIRTQNALSARVEKTPIQPTQPCMNPVLKLFLKLILKLLSRPAVVWVRPLSGSGDKYSNGLLQLDSMLACVYRIVRYSCRRLQLYTVVKAKTAAGHANAIDAPSESVY